MEHPEIVKGWYPSNLVVLEVPNEETLLDLADCAHYAGLRYSMVVEPDYGNEHTAIAIEPSDATSKLCASLPLMLKEKRLAA